MTVYFKTRNLIRTTLGSMFSKNKKTVRHDYDKQFKILIKTANFARKRPQTALEDQTVQTGRENLKESQNVDPKSPSQNNVGRKGIFFTHYQTEQMQVKQLKCVFKRIEGMQLSVNNFKRSMSQTKTKVEKASGKGRFESRGTADEQGLTCLLGYN